MPLSSSNPPLSKPNQPTTNEIWHYIISKIRFGLSTLKRSIGIWAERSRQRRALAQLSAYQLKDIGISRGDAINEVRKPFWES